MGRNIVITSGKGGVGKTSITSGIGIALAEQNVKVALVDADIGLNNLDVALGVENRAVYDIGDVVAGRARLSQAFLTDIYLPNLYILPSTKRDTGITPQAFRSLIDRISETFEYVLIDCPAGIEDGFHRAVSAASEAIVVTTPHISAVRDADKVLALLTGYGLNSVSLIINRIRSDLVQRGEMISADDISALLRAKTIGYVPEDDQITLSSGAPRLTGNKSLSKKAFSIIAENIRFNSNRLIEASARLSVADRIMNIVRKRNG